MLCSAARRCEEVLEKRKRAEEIFLASAAEVCQWLDEAEQLLQMGEEALEKSQEPTQHGINSALLRDKFEKYEDFFTKSQATSHTSMVSLNRSLEDILHIKNSLMEDAEIPTGPLDPSLVTAHETVTALSNTAQIRVQELRDRYEVSVLTKLYQLDHIGVEIPMLLNL